MLSFQLLKTREARAALLLRLSLLICVLFSSGYAPPQFIRGPRVEQTEWVLSPRSNQKNHRAYSLLIPSTPALSDTRPSWRLSVFAYSRVIKNLLIQRACTLADMALPYRPVHPAKRFPPALF